MSRRVARFRSFASDEDGMVMILVSIMLPVLIGFALLVIDMSRANNLHNDLQKAADSMALAAAAELDGQSDAITRAERAMANLVQNEYRFSDAGPAQILARAGITRRFLKSLPANDWQPVVAANVVTNEVLDAGLARYIEVTVSPVGFTTIFPASFLTGNAASNTMDIGAVGVAGFTSGVCDYTPIFICNPYEASPGGVTLEAAVNTRQYRRKQVKIRYQESWNGGNFGFLESPFGNGANALGDMLASKKPLACYADDGVETKTGQNTGQVETGLNSRFGIGKGYIGSTNNGPAQNVRMGLKSVNCNNAKVSFETNPERGVGLERDACHIAGNCSELGGRLGDGNWNFARYWRVNHTVNGTPRAIPSELSGTGANLPTRYEVYRYEIAHNLVTDASVGGETGTPACSQTPVTSVDRRILYGAVVDCEAAKQAGINMNGKTVLPVRAFASFFLTEPIKSAGGNDVGDGKEIFAEIIDITGRGGRGTLDNFLRDEAQLYR